MSGGDHKELECPCLFLWLPLEGVRKSKEGKRVGKRAGWWGERCPDGAEGVGRGQERCLCRPVHGQQSGYIPLQAPYSFSEDAGRPRPELWAVVHNTGHQRSEECEWRQLGAGRSQEKHFDQSQAPTRDTLG